MSDAWILICLVVIVALYVALFVTAHKLHLKDVDDALGAADSGEPRGERERLPGQRVGETPPV
jgi:hypothetical protein